MPEEKEAGMDKRKTGEMIRKARTEKGYTQSELGALLNISNKAVSRWENGETFPDVGVLEQLATVLDLKIGDIVTGEEGADTETVLTDITREVKIQKNRRDRKVSKAVFLTVGFGFMLIYGLSQFVYRRGDGLLSITGLPFCIMPIYLAVTAFPAIRTHEMRSVFYSRRSTCFGIVGIVEALFMCSVLLSAVRLYPAGKTLFGIKPASIGPALIITVMIPFFISLLMISIGAITWEFNYGWFIHIYDMFLAIALNGTLYNIESVESAARAINYAKLVLLAEMLVAVGITLIANHKYTLSKE